MDREAFRHYVHPFLMGAVDNPKHQCMAMQSMIDTGDAWQLEGYYGREAHRMIEDGMCVAPNAPITEEITDRWEDIEALWEHDQHLIALEQRTYKTVVLDPPWNERGGGKYKRGADKHYPLMKTPDIIRTIYNCEYWGKIEENAHMYMWVTNNFLPEGLKVIDALGFRYVTNFVWVKDKIGLGQYFRGQHELCLFATRGKKPTAPRTENKTLASVLHSPRTKHSRKPPSSYELIEQRSQGHYLELFAREPQGENWTVWGNEV